MLGKNGFGVKLYAFDGVIAMTHPHQLSVRGPCRDRQAIGERRFVDDEGVIARPGERRG